PVAHPDREIFGTRDVGAPGLELVVGGMPRAAELEIFLVGPGFVAVEDYLGLAAVARHAAEHFMLAALAEFAEIGIRAIRRGYAGIVFLDPPAHLLDQRLLQRFGVAEQAVGIGVLFLQIFANVLVEDRRVAQHLLPVRVL